MGCGAWIKISGRERIHLHWNGGPGTNKEAELMALWGGLYAAADMELSDVHIYGDSALVIGYIKGSLDIQCPDLQGWISRIRHLWYILGSPPLSHIYRNLNMRTDGLSKMGLNSEFGAIQVVKYWAGVRTRETSIPIP